MKAKLTFLLLWKSMSQYIFKLLLEISMKIISPFVKKATHKLCKLSKKYEVHYELSFLIPFCVVNLSMGRLPLESG